jgi:hypothetical protein
MVHAINGLFHIFLKPFHRFHWKFFLLISFSLFSFSSKLNKTLKNAVGNSVYCIIEYILPNLVSVLPSLKESYSVTVTAEWHVTGLRPEMRNHYRGHKMSLWLNLIPQLHRPGGDDLNMRHHHFQEEGAQFYEGELFYPPHPLSILKVLFNQC